MAIVACPQGHYYDDAKYASCPHCANGSGLLPAAEAALDLALDLDFELTSAFSPDDEAGEDDPTIGFFGQRIDAEPVVGWLVAVEGPERGRDYRLHSGRNSVGRGYENDVVIVEDRMVSRVSHCFVVFEPRESVFFIVPGAGTTWLVGKMVGRATPLQDGASLSVGDTRLVLTSFCTPKRRIW
jgi:hypothetical protein